MTFYYVCVALFLFLCGGVARAVPSKHNEHAVIVKTVSAQKNERCSVRDVSGEEVVVPRAALCGPQVFFVIARADGFYFWTLADAQLLLKLIARREHGGDMQVQLEVLSMYVHDRHQQPADEVKYAAVIELFTAFSIKPRPLKNFKQWSVALTIPVRDVLEDSLSLLENAADLAVIDATTGGVTAVPMGASVKKRMLNERAAGIAPFPFLYRRSSLPKVDYTKKPTKSFAGTSASRGRSLAQGMLVGIVVIGGGIALTKWNTPSHPPVRVSPPDTIVKPAPQKAQNTSQQEKKPPKGGRFFAPRCTAFRRGCVDSISVKRMKASLRKNAVKDEELEDGDREFFPSSQEAWEEELKSGVRKKDSYLRLLKKGTLDPQTVAGYIGIEAVARVIGVNETQRIWGQEVADACFADNAMDDVPEDAASAGDSSWVDAVQFVPAAPLFFLVTRNGVIAIIDERYVRVRAQCSRAEQEMLDTVVKVRRSAEDDECLRCDSVIVRDERILALFKKYAPELFA